MGGIVLELTENVFGRVSRGLLRETPTRGEQTQPGSDGGAMDQSSIAKTSIRLTRTSRLRKLPPARAMARSRNSDWARVWSAE
jgi:hypothetical protein